LGGENLRKLNVTLTAIIILLICNPQQSLSESKLLNKNSKIAITPDCIPKYINVGIVKNVPAGYAHYRRPNYVITVPFTNYIKTVVAHEWWLNNSLCNKEAIKAACVTIRTTTLWFYSDKYDLDDIHGRAVNKIAANGKPYDIVSNAFRQVWLADAYSKLKPYKKTLLDAAINETTNEIITFSGTNYLGYIQYNQGYYNSYKHGTNKISQKGTWWLENVFYKGASRNGYNNKTNNNTYLSILKYYLSTNLTITNIDSN
jgi:hypothetical protein